MSMSAWIWIICGIIAIIAILFIEAIKEGRKENDSQISYITEATVIAVGYQGVTVEYYDDDGYGEKSAATAKIAAEKENYQVGDKVTIQVDKNLLFDPPTTTIKFATGEFVTEEFEEENIKHRRN